MEPFISVPWKFHLLSAYCNNKIQNRVTYFIKTGYYLDTEDYEITCEYRKKYGWNVPHLANFEILLVHLNIINNKHQRDLWVLSTLVPNKSFGQLFNISQRQHIYTKAFHSEFL